MTCPIICIPCKREMRPLKNGVFAIEHFEDDGEPYRIWSADLIGCACGTRVVSRFGLQPIAEHFQPGFNEHLKRALESEHVYHF